MRAGERAGEGGRREMPCVNLLESRRGLPWEEEEGWRGKDWREEIGGFRAVTGTGTGTRSRLLQNVSWSFSVD